MQQAAHQTNARVCVCVVCVCARVCVLPYGGWHAITSSPVTQDNAGPGKLVHCIARHAHGQQAAVFKAALRAAQQPLVKPVPRAHLCALRLRVDEVYEYPHVPLLAQQPRKRLQPQVAGFVQSQRVDQAANVLVDQRALTVPAGRRLFCAGVWGEAGRQRPCRGMAAAWAWRWGPVACAVGSAF
jgi:hypothetical protein